MSFKLPSKVNDISKLSDKIIVDSVYKRIVDEVENIKYNIMTGYDGLSMVVTDVNSKTNPALYRESFENKLNEFEFIEHKNKDKIKLITPDMDNFSFMGLDIIKQIFNGTMGVFAEISQTDLEKITGKTTVNENPIDNSVSKQNRIYLIKYTSEVRMKEKNVLNKLLVRFPFSNMPPLYNRVFGRGQEYVDENLDSWIQESIEEGQARITRYYKGVK